jgi:hypothetical protein
MFNFCENIRSFRKFPPTNELRENLERNFAEKRNATQWPEKNTVQTRFRHRKKKSKFSKQYSTGYFIVYNLILLEKLICFLHIHLFRCLCLDFLA